MDLSLIIRKVLAGDKEEFRHIIKHCNQPLFRTAIAILKNESDAEDAMQSAYLKAFVHLHSFRGESSVLTWITRILINECKMMLRAKKKPASLDSVEVLQKESLTENAVEKIDKDQIHHWLEQAVLELPEKYRMVYVVREINEFSTQNAAAALGITEQNVKIRLHRAKSIIRENLLQQVGANELFPYGNRRCDSITEKVMKIISDLPVAQYQ
jgi:RNA polymerase sigma-70 factor, ECF subfamily